MTVHIAQLLSAEFVKVFAIAQKHFTGLL